ncbi:nitrite/sulfite reductase [Nesterenkonia lacusekhoensis]|uniref:assimilatory sulfite reductase (ferredoxin) n=1 Tax=Nesterenkonia lacusekhoensis TaxID=150832 RepID=A0ABS4T4L5_9MICC|nr:nitrite/sulfite reductase [Nesterenkonia lacusekhoensis]MBP2318909.1 sulfite reductase (ferredoxin) [Nesterenkonia lacusekhoensis]
MASLTPTETADAAPKRPARPSKRPNGQWKVDGTDPLNHNEEFKQADNGLNVRERIEQIYSKQGFASIEPDDLRGRFRWWGLYTQRRPGVPAGAHTSLPPEEVDDEYFMLRVRIDGGALTTEQLRTIGELSRDYARNTADVTDRQNIQLHWVRVEDVPEIWRRLEAVDLGTTEACGDTPRVILGSPVAGISADEIIDPTPVIQEISQRYIGDDTLSNLPRKYKTAITGHPSQDVVHEINDFGLVGLDHAEHGPGYDLWVGGGLSTNSRLAERLGAFVTQEEAPEVWHAVTQAFRDYGYRRLRNKARMKFLINDWGAEKFRQVIEDEYLGYRLKDGPPAPAPSIPGDHVGVHAQKDGRYYIGAAPVVGRVDGELLIRLAELLEAHGSHRLRTTPHQKIVVLDIAAEHIDSVKEGLKALDLDPEPTVFRRSTMACTGIEYCKLAIVETKVTARQTIEQLETRLADVADQLPERLTLHINGCPNSCARIQTADIGLKGQLLPDDDGEKTPGFQVHLGGGLASSDREDPGLGRTVRGLKVTADGLVDYSEALIRRYLRSRSSASETFAEWAHRVDESHLQLEDPEEQEGSRA